jgi:hypothetical protein
MIGVGAVAKAAACDIDGATHRLSRVGIDGGNLGAAAPDVFARRRFND